MQPARPVQQEEEVAPDASKLVSQSRESEFRWLQLDITAAERDILIVSTVLKLLLFPA